MHDPADNLQTYKLTQYSHGAGCGCKIAPKVLDKILRNPSYPLGSHTLLVGNSDRDDAAVIKLDSDTGIISTTDFFMPIVDDAADFGRIASVNAISDVYAMGGTPLMAVAILGWPVNELPAELAGDVIQGAREACAEAGIALAGGHSIDSPEPIFGLAVTGRVKIDHLKRNGGARPGSKLYLSKPLGVGILTTASKKNLLQEEHLELAKQSMLQLNKIGELFGQQDYIEAMTDVTGFGLLGHLCEMCEASDCGAVIELGKVPLLDKRALDGYISQGCVPGGTQRNWDSYGHKISPITDYQKAILCDPQTSGGLLVAVASDHAETFEELVNRHNLPLQPFGYITEASDTLIQLIGE